MGIGMVDTRDNFWWSVREICGELEASILNKVFRVRCQDTLENYLNQLDNERPTCEGCQTQCC